MQWLVEELKTSAEHILELLEVRNMYCELAELAGMEVPQSFVSRRATLKEKLQLLLNVYDFVVMHNERDGESMMHYKAGDNEFLELVHVSTEA